MVTVALIYILSAYFLESALVYRHYGDKKEASDCIRLWAWTVGSLVANWLLTELNAYLLQ